MNERYNPVESDHGTARVEPEIVDSATREDFGSTVLPAVFRAKLRLSGVAMLTQPVSGETLANSSSVEGQQAALAGSKPRSSSTHTPDAPSDRPVYYSHFMAATSVLSCQNIPTSAPSCT